MSSVAAVHVPVLLDEVVDAAAVHTGSTIVDCTFGAGGHARELAALAGSRGLYVAIDRDPDVQEHVESLREAVDCPVRFARGNYAAVLPELLAEGVRADVVLMDLGISSMQVDRPERGFSYSRQAPLDMRMDPDDPLSAADLVATASEAQLAQWLWTYGEERYGRQIARAIARRRATRPIETTADLVEVVRQALPTPALFGAGHPAKRVFQALRIAVNDELGSLERGLGAAFELLTPGGRLVVIAFHSLEDRIVKRFMAQRARGCVCPPELPACVCGRAPEAVLVTPRAVRPRQDETDVNPRAKSARLRAIARTGPL